MPEPGIENETDSLQPVAQWVDELLCAQTTQAAFDRIHAFARSCGFADVSYMAGLAFDDPASASGAVPQKIYHHSSCPGDWLEELFAVHGPEHDYDIQRFLLGQTAPFVSGSNILGLMPPLEAKQREILALKARHGFGANLIVPLPSAPYRRPCYAAFMYVSDLDEDAFGKTIARWYHLLVAMAHLFHQSLGGDAYSVLERESQVAVRMMALEGQAGSQAAEEGFGPTAAQMAALELLARGARLGDIADMLSISKVSVDRRLRGARQRLGAQTTAEAIAIAVDRGLITRRAKDAPLVLDELPVIGDEPED